MLSIFVGIFLITALAGRVWCGWGCPQTVYLELLFRPIEQWLEGSRGQQLKLDQQGPNWRRVVKWFVFAALSVAVANVFLSYFVSPYELMHWLTRPPAEHPVGFAVVLATSALVFFDFAYFREQMCTVICPYARLQSALLDKHSLIVGYDAKRGEPRGQGRSGGGDCIDCKACVIACPTGIDIRDGLQLECITCAQCVDACNGVMRKLKKPEGLIRYASQAWFQSGKKPRWLRPRTVAYPLVLLTLLSALVIIGQKQTRSAEVTVLRGIGAPFAERGALVQNQLRIKIHNRSDADGAFEIQLQNAGNSQLVLPENPVRIAGGKHATATVFVMSERGLFTSGTRDVEVVVQSEQFEGRFPYRLLGP
jgi:cytochrome c oxidase accessory protein FixG